MLSVPLGLTRGGFALPAAAKPPFRFWSFFFSLQGRVSRLAIWAFVIPYDVTFFLASRYIHELQSNSIHHLTSVEGFYPQPWVIGYLVLGIVEFLMFWPIFAVIFKRLHDIRLSGLISLITLAPFVLAFARGFARTGLHVYIKPEPMIFFGLGMAVWIAHAILAVIPGTSGANRYGNDPCQAPEQAQDVF